MSIDEGYACLTLREQATADRLSSAGRYHHYVMSHYLLRRLLADAVGCDMDSIHYQLSAYGKPEVVGCSVHFNLSHSADMAVVAISKQGPVGIDVEYCRPRDSLQGVARRFFAPPEIDYIYAAPDQISAFYQVWTAKEAYLKAQGLGISSGLNAFSVVDEQSGRLVSPLASWVFHEIDIALDYQCCLFSSALYNPTERILIKSV